MSSLEPPVLPAIRLAPHERLKIIFTAAPYLEAAFQEFLEGCPDSRLLEEDRIYLAICRFYVVGRKLSEDCWSNGAELTVPEPKIMHDELERARVCRRKRQGGRLWEHARRLWKDVLREELPARSPRMLLFLEASGTRKDALRIALVHMIMRLREVWRPPEPKVCPPEPEVPRPKRVASARPPRIK